MLQRKNAGVLAVMLLVFAKVRIKNFINFFVEVEKESNLDVKCRIRETCGISHVHSVIPDTGKKFVPLTNIFYWFNLTFFLK